MMLELLTGADWLLTSEDVPLTHTVGGAVIVSRQAGVDGVLVTSTTTMS